MEYITKYSVYRVFIFFLATSVALIIGLSSPSMVLAQTCEGTVRDANTGNPLANVAVEILVCLTSAPGSCDSINQTTDSTGYWRTLNTFDFIGNIQSINYSLSGYSNRTITQNGIGGCVRCDESSCQYVGGDPSNVSLVPLAIPTPTVGPGTPTPTSGPTPPVYSGWPCINPTGLTPEARCGTSPVSCDPTGPNCYPDQNTCFNECNVTITPPPPDIPVIRLTDLLGTLPPLPHEVPTVDEFLTRYRRWRNEFLSSVFSYVPFSSTEDRIGLVELTNAVIQPIQFDVIVTDIQILNQDPAELFFAHMQETNRLGMLLQMTFTPSGGPIHDFTPSKVARPENPFCDIAQVRTNPGDNLFATEIYADIYYTANLYCTYTTPGEGRVCERVAGGTCLQRGVECLENYGRLDCDPGDICGRVCMLRRGCTPCTDAGGMWVPTDWNCEAELDIWTGCTNPGDYKCGVICSAPITVPTLTELCERDFYISIGTVTETPKIDKIWARLVAGPMAVFKRIFPRIEEGADRPIERLWDMPAVTRAIFRSLDGTPIYAGSPSNLRPGSQAELYFPHIGGVHEYFLHCIQKTLRPQGFGDGCISAPFNFPSPGPGVCEGTDVAHEGPIPVLGGYCEPAVSGWCSPTTLMSLGWPAASAQEASIICNRESSGYTNAFNDGCLCNRSVDYSIGLFQINLLAWCAGRDGFEWDWNRDPICTITNQSLVDDCAAHFFNPINNIAFALELSQYGTNWSHWGEPGICF